MHGRFALLAAGVYHLAMRDEKLPRFDPNDMPDAPKPEGEDRPTQQ